MCQPPLQPRLAQPPLRLICCDGSAILPLAGNGGPKSIKVDRLESPAVASHPLRLLRRCWSRCALAPPIIGPRAGRLHCQRVEPPSPRLRRARRQRVPPWLFCAMIQLSYRSSKTEVRESEIHGRGLFAIADIARDEIVAVKGGHIVDRKNFA